MTSEIKPDSGISSLAFFLADFAVVESGKAYVSGGFWDRIAVPEFPSSAFFSVVAVIHVPWSAYHQLHNFSISVEDAAGTELEPGFDGQFQVSSAPHLRVGDPTIMPVTGSIPGMTFEGPGEFSFILRINGAEVDRWPLRVLLVDPSLGDQRSAIPVGPPVEQPSPEQSGESATGRPAGQSVETAAESPADEPVKSAAEKLAEAPADNPVDKLPESPADEPADKPADKKLAPDARKPKHAAKPAPPSAPS